VVGICRFHAAAQAVAGLLEPAIVPHHCSIDECQMNEKTLKINRLNLRLGDPDYWSGWFISSQNEKVSYNVQAHCILRSRRRGRRWPGVARLDGG
jgi:hypothetical protein